MAEKKGSSRAEKAVSNVKKKVDAPASSKSAGKKTAAGPAGRGGAADRLSREAEKEAVCPPLPGGENPTGAGLYGAGVGRGPALVAYLRRSGDPAQRIV